MVTSRSILTSDEIDHLICGAVAGGVARLFVAPLDLIKIRHQIQDKSVPKQYFGVIQTSRQILNTEGILAFWKGNLSAELMVVPYVAIQFAVFHLAKRHLVELSVQMPSRINDLVSGSVAGATATVCVYPLDLLRTRMAAQQMRRAKFLETIHQSWSMGGVRELYRGLWPTLVGIIPYAALQFSLYGQFNELGTHLLGDNNISEKRTSAVHFWSGFLAGLGSKLLTMPFDVIKKRSQVSGYRWRTDQHRVPKESSVGVIRLGMHIVRNEGLGALYKGSKASLLKAAPNSAVTFFTFEFCRRLLATNQN